MLRRKFWAAMWLNGVDMRGLTWERAALVAITHMERVHKDPLKLDVEWRKLADALGVALEEDPDLAAERDAVLDERLRGMLGIGEMDLDKSLLGVPSGDGNQQEGFGQAGARQEDGRPKVPVRPPAPRRRTVRGPR